MSKRTTADFVELASAVHGNKYDYSKVEYKGSGVRVCIICPIHGGILADTKRPLAWRRV